MSTTIDPTIIDVSRGHLLDEWLTALDAVVDKLRAGAMVADVSCAQGQSTILMAQAFPRSAFTGYDVHAESIAIARQRAREAIAATASGRNVRFELSDAAAIPAYAYDLVTTFDALDGTGDPVAAARGVRRAIADDGTWMLVESPDGDRPARLTAILEDAGFSRVRIAAESPVDVVLEARP